MTPFFVAWFLLLALLVALLSLNGNDDGTPRF